MKRRRDRLNEKLPELVNNPLEMFPTKGDSIRRTFLSSKSATQISRENNEGDEEENSKQLGLRPSRIDSTVCTCFFF